MNDKNRTKAQLIEELSELRQGVGEVGNIEIDRTQAGDTRDVFGKRWEHLIASVPSVVYSCKIEGQRFIPTFVGPNLEANFGYAEEELLGDSSWWASGIHLR